MKWILHALFCAVGTTLPVILLGGNPLIIVANIIVVSIAAPSFEYMVMEDLK